MSHRALSHLYRALDMSKESRSQRKLLRAIADLHNTHMVIPWPTVERARSRSGMSGAGFDNALDIAIGRGLVEVIERTNVAGQRLAPTLALVGVSSVPSPNQPDPTVPHWWLRPSHGTA